jgi:hypothetical protein
VAWSANVGCIPEVKVFGRNRDGAVNARVARVFSREPLIASSSAKISGGIARPMGATGLSASTLSNRSGSIRTMYVLMRPPVEWVARWQRSMPRHRIAASMSRACCRIV